MKELVNALIIENGKILIARKDISRRSSWVFPGDKIEIGEHPYETLIRELNNELPYMKWEGLWVPWQYFFGVSPNGKSPLKVLAYYLDGKTNGDYRHSGKYEETKIMDSSSLLDLELSDTSKNIVCKLRHEGKI